MLGDLAKLQRSLRDQAKWQKARQQLLGGQFVTALTTSRELSRSYPALAELWFELGTAAAGTLDFSLANDAYQRARKLAVHNAPLLGMIGQQYQGLRQLDDARTCYEAACQAGVVGRGKHYAAAFEPHLEKLAPSCRAFGSAG